MVTAIILFVIGALFGLHILTHVLKDKPTPKISVLLHGLFVAIPLIIVIIKTAKGEDVTSTLIASLIFFIIAALGGFLMVYLDLGKGKLPPKALAILHPILAAVGLVLLIVFTIGK
jgi:heme A synthase